jgi:hypothetical protein
VVERFLGKEEVAGSIPALGSSYLRATTQVDRWPERTARKALYEHIIWLIARPGSEQLAKALGKRQGVEANSRAGCVVITGA